VLGKERKRADRSNEPVVLLLVAVNDGLGANSPLTWAAVTESCPQWRMRRRPGVVRWRAVMG